MKKIQRQAKEVAESLLESKYAVALTGAGASTESGIPDFRSPGSGLWETTDDISVFTFMGFRKEPEKFYRLGTQIFETVSRAKPNLTHYALAELERLGLIKSIITQNVDSLHQKAGSKNVIEVHGHLRELECLSCGAKYSMGEILRHYGKNHVSEFEVPPRCPSCGGLLKPTIVLFGEKLPHDEFGKAMEELKKADLLLIIGSSLLVHPVNSFPMKVIENGGELIIINLQRTPYDSLASLVVREKSGVFMKEVLHQVHNLLLQKKL